MAELREAYNRFDIVGVLAEKNLEIKNFNGKDAIVGDLVIKTGENSFHKVKVFANQMTSSGTESKSFISLKTVMDEYKSIADTGNEDEADKVSAFGKLSEGKPYLNTNTNEVVTFVANQLSFISRVKDGNYEPKAKWQGEVFVQSYQPEMKKQDGDEELTETGRKIMNVVVPTYGGKAFPMKLVLEDDGAEWFEDNVTRNSTVKVYVDLINTTEKIVQGQTSGGFGKKEPRVFTKILNEKIVVGADDPYEEFDAENENNKAYDKDLITKALATREEAIEEAKNSGGDSTPKTGFGGKSNSTPSNSTSGSKNTPVEEDDEIPF